MVLTSPPYWGLRNYGLRPVEWNAKLNCDHIWGSPGRPTHPGQVEQTKWKAAFGAGRAGNAASGRFCRRCSAWRGSLGLEPSPDLYIRHLVTVFDEVRRVLKPTGTCWVNLGDTYCAPARNRLRNAWLRPKQLLLIPSRFAIVMQEHGWLLRNDIVWHEPNAMPSSVKDRFNCSWEHVFFFVKSPQYYFDLDAVREPHVSLARRPFGVRRAKTARNPSLTGAGLAPEPSEPGAFHALGKNPGDFWRLAPETRSLGAITGSRGAVKEPEGVGWVGHPPGGQTRIVREWDQRWLPPGGKNPGDAWSVTTTPFKAAHFAVFPEKLCERPILAGCPPGGLVMDPFAGAGTVGVVAKVLLQIVVEAWRDLDNALRRQIR